MTFRIFLFYICFSLFLVSCSTKEESEARSDDDATLPENVPSVLKVERRPDKVANFTWKDTSGNTVNFDSFKGAVTLINFWATWCGPCKKEFPDLIQLSHDFASLNVKILGIATDRGTNAAQDVQTFIGDHGITYQILLSTEELEEAFGNVRALPTSFLIDREGRIVQTFVGMRSKEFFAGSIRALLK